MSEGFGVETLGTAAGGLLQDLIEGTIKFGVTKATEHLVKKWERNKRVALQHLIDSNDAGKNDAERTAIRARWAKLKDDTKTDNEENWLVEMVSLYVFPEPPEKIQEIQKAAEKLRDEINALKRNGKILVFVKDLEKQLKAFEAFEHVETSAENAKRFKTLMKKDDAEFWRTLDTVEHDPFWEWLRGIKSSMKDGIKAVDHGLGKAAKPIEKWARKLERHRKPKTVLGKVFQFIAGKRW